MTATCQSVKRSCNLFIEPQLISFLVLYNFPHVFKTFIAYHSIWWYQLSGKFRIDRYTAIPLDANTRNTTSVKMTGSIIL